MDQIIKGIFSIDNFAKIFKKLMLTPKKLENNECSYLLSVAIMLLKYYERRNKKIYFDLAYYIILKYSISFNDYRPLYDISLNMGFYPVSSYVYKYEMINLNNLSLQLIENEINILYKRNDIIRTKEQYKIGKEVLQDKSYNISYVAPTSFGKSELIIDHIKNNKYNKIAIIVPSKSLISQTYDLIRSSQLLYKIIIHDEMYNNETRFIAILTQERALRLIEKCNVTFDMLYIDEAHNILDNDVRAILLTRLIQIVKEQNNNCCMIFLSPIVNNSNNILINKKDTIKEYKIQYDIKQAEYYVYDSKSKNIEKFNQYNTEYYYMGSTDNYLNYIMQNSGNKNFLFAKKPKDIEKIAKEINKKIEYNNINSSKINEIIEVLKENIHADYYEIETIRNGCIYLHGLLPEHIKDYLQAKFRQIEEIKYIIANEVILEGVNMPIDRLFILNTYGISINSLRNLVGRVNRLNYIFIKPYNLNKLMPQIHFINYSFYSRDMKNLLNNIGREFKDKVKNPLLKNYKHTIKDKTKNDKIISDEQIYFMNPQTKIEKIKQLLLKTELNTIYNLEDSLCEIIQKNIEYKRNIDESNFLDCIYDIFFNNIDPKYFIDKEVVRLKNIQAIRFYKLFYEYRSLPFNEIIQKYFIYYKNKKNSKTHYLYIGEQFGEEIFQDNNTINTNSQNIKKKSKYKNVYIDIRKKTDKELVNLLIIKHSLEQQFVTYNLNKFIKFLFYVEMISVGTYNYIIYGCKEDFEVKYIQMGIPLNIVNLLKKDDQLKNIIKDKYNNYTATEDFIAYYKNLDDYKKFVIEKYIKIS